MAQYNHIHVLPMTNASAIGEGLAVQGIAGEKVVGASSINVRPIGLTIASTATYGKSVGVLVLGVGKAMIAASVGAFSLVGVASTNGALGPVTPSGLAPIASNYVASGYIPQFAVGYILKNGAVGDVQPVWVAPQEVF